MAREEIEAMCREVGKALGFAVGDECAFALLLFEFGENGWSTYVSNAEREDMIRALEELLANMKSSPPLPPITGGGPVTVGEA